MADDIYIHVDHACYIILPMAGARTRPVIAGNVLGSPATTDILYLCILRESRRDGLKSPR